MATDDARSISRRRLLAASGGALAVPTVGAAPAGARGDDRLEDSADPPWRCPDATIRPAMEACAGAGTDACDDDHPETRSLRESVEGVLEERYPTVGDLIDDGFKPYFDTLDRGDGGWSHWLSPEFIGDDGILDPDRPESVLVDNRLWRPIGVMFVATRGGDRVDPPPAVYEEDDRRCSPWHSHVGFPGRFAWWYYRQVYEGDYREGDLLLPCRTPCVMHVWTVPHPEGTHAHDGPPPEYREGATAATAGFSTDAEPGTDDLGWDVLPDEVVPPVTPADLRERIGL